MLVVPPSVPRSSIVVPSCRKACVWLGGSACRPTLGRCRLYRPCRGCCCRPACPGLP
jgi:hypothetical protein